MNLLRRVQDRITGSEWYDQLVFRKRVLLESDRAFVCRQFRKAVGHAPDLEDPRKFCEKITWLLLNYRPPALSSLVDKYEVRAFVRERVGAAFLNELHGVYSSTAEIRWEALPRAVVLKATHGAKWVLICPDQSRLDRNQARREMDRWLSRNFYWFGREWIYRDVPHRIIAERFLDGGNGKPPPDYKFFCFDGQPRLIQLDAARFENHRRNFYRPDWSLVPVKMIYPNLPDPVPAPSKLDEMLQVARRLSAGFPFARVDLYQVANQVIFGEMTFLPERGLCAFDDPAFDREVGGWLPLPPPMPDKGFFSRLSAVFQ